MAHMAQEAQVAQTALGNTKPKPKRVRARKWCFTLNNYTEEDYGTMAQHFEEGQFIIGKEIGENGTPHLQGYVEFKNPKDLSVLKKINERIHWEITKGNRKQNFEYCSKDGNYITNMKIKKPIKIIENLRPWQTVIFDCLKTEPDDRTIVWVTDKEGNKGKTALCKYLHIKFGALYLTGKASDMKYTLTQWIDTNPDDEIPPILMDFTRSTEQFISYQGIEEIKNGIFMNTKYECKMVVYNSPHIIIFANFMPELNKLSKDRWKIIDISDDAENEH